MKQKLVNCNPEILRGTPVFAGTRVPLQNLVDCSEAGYSIDDFLEDFPSVTREQVFQFLEQGKKEARGGCGLSESAAGRVPATSAHESFGRTRSQDCAASGMGWKN